MEKVNLYSQQARSILSILEPIKKLKIPTDELVIVGGAALQIHGLKYTNDIDVVVADDRYNKVVNQKTLFKRQFRRQIGRVGALEVIQGAKEGLVVGKGDYGELMYGGISYMKAPADNLYQATFSELHDEAVNIKGVLVSPLQRILEWKQAVHRSKDEHDIELIEAQLDYGTKRNFQEILDKGDKR